MIELTIKKAGEDPTLVGDRCINKKTLKIFHDPSAGCDLLGSDKTIFVTMNYANYSSQEFPHELNKSDTPRRDSFCVALRKEGKCIDDLRDISYEGDHKTIKVVLKTTPGPHGINELYYKVFANATTPSGLKKDLEIDPKIGNTSYGLMDPLIHLVAAAVVSGIVSLFVARKTVKKMLSK